LRLRMDDNPNTSVAIGVTINPATVAAGSYPNVLTEMTAASNAIAALDRKPKPRPLRPPTAKSAMRITFHASCQVKRMLPTAPIKKPPK